MSKLNINLTYLMLTSLIIVAQLASALPAAVDLSKRADGVLYLPDKAIALGNIKEKSLFF